MGHLSLSYERRSSRFDESSVAVEVGSEATASSAARRDGGSAFPLFSARRSIPAQALALKKNRRGTSPVSKMSDKEDATAPLWYSGVLSVVNSVGEPIPEFLKSGQETGERMVFVSFVLVFNHDLFPVSGSVWAVQVVFRWTLIGRDVGS